PSRPVKLSGPQGAKAGPRLVIAEHRALRDSTLKRGENPRVGGGSIFPLATISYPAAQQDVVQQAGNKDPGFDAQIRSAEQSNHQRTRIEIRVAARHARREPEDECGYSLPANPAPIPVATASPLHEITSGIATLPHEI